jgi:hypothetical protein
VALSKNSLAFTVCQVPVIYQLGNQETIQVTYTDGTKETFDGTTLNETISYKVFDRTGAIVSLIVTINEAVVL